MKVCVVVVTYNRFETLKKTLDQVLMQQRPVDYFLVVDNGSRDNTVDSLRGLGKPVDILEINNNLGYGAGLSLGIKHALSHHKDIDFFWLLDDDSLPKPELLKVMLESRLTTGKPGIICVTGFVDHLWNGPVRVSRNARTTTALYPVDHVLIDGAMVDRSVVDAVGTPREDLFMMCEDFEYSKRIKSRGFDVFVLPGEDLMDRLHLGGGERFSKGTLWRGYYHARNHMAILRIYFTWRNLAAYIIRQTKYLAASMAAKDRRKRISLRLLGIYHGLIGKMGKTIDPAKMI